MGVFEYETKYICDNTKASLVSSWLDCKFQKDTSYPEAIINSVYYDTINMKYLEEKVNSDYLKSKFRVRWYQDIETLEPSADAFLEFKHKIGNRREKVRKKVENKFSEIPLTSTAFYEPMNSLRIYKGRAQEKIFPFFIIRYTRKRYLIPNTNIRICIDYNIHVPKINPLFSRQVKKTYLRSCVFEVKYNDIRLPKELMFLEKMGLKKEAFSKYSNCFDELIRI